MPRVNALTVTPVPGQPDLWAVEEQAAWDTHQYLMREEDLRMLHTGVPVFLRFDAEMSPELRRRVENLRRYLVKRLRLCRSSRWGLSQSIRLVDDALRETYKTYRDQQAAPEGER